MPEEACRRALDRFGIRDGTALLAISGGLDSRVLLDVMQRLAPAHGLRLVVGHVNHQLRGEASESDQSFVLRLADKAGLRGLSRRVSPDELRRNQSSRTRPTLEEAARELRRKALEAIAEEAEAKWIMTAHHAGDQAETILLRILRGTGAQGLAGMAPRSSEGRWLRPFLDCDPGRLVEYATAHGLDWREDASNGDPAFSRNRLRSDWIPGLRADFNPQLLRTLCNLAETIREEAEWIEGIVERAAADRIATGPEGVELALDGWDLLPEALARRIVRHALVLSGLERDLSRAHILRVLEFLRRGRQAGRDRRVELPRGIVLRRRTAGFLLVPSKAPQERSDEIESADNATVLGRD